MWLLYILYACACTEDHEVYFAAAFSGRWEKANYTNDMILF